VYFDFAINGSKTVLLALQNSDEVTNLPVKRSTSNRLSLLPPTNVSSAAPISLLARVDDEEYLVLPSASGIVPIRKGNFDANSRHDVRIIAPMATSDGLETLQVQGIWIDEGGRLLPCENPTSSKNSVSAEDVGSQIQYPLLEKPKMLEIVTDLPGAKTGKDRQNNNGMTHAILGGVMGWEYLLGEMFGSDHATVGMDGMCLIQDCVGGRGSPVGLADVFFQRSSTIFILEVHN